MRKSKINRLLQSIMDIDRAMDEVRHEAQRPVWAPFYREETDRDCLGWDYNQYLRNNFSRTEPSVLWNYCRTQYEPIYRHAASAAEIAEMTRPAPDISDEDLETILNMP